MDADAVILVGCKFCNLCRAEQPSRTAKHGHLPCCEDTRVARADAAQKCCLSPQSCTNVGPPLFAAAAAECDYVAGTDVVAWVRLSMGSRSRGRLLIW